MNKSVLILSALLLCNSLYADEPQSVVGKDIFEGYCANACHQTPKATGLNNKQWQVVINTMQKRMKSAGIPPLTQGEQKLLLDYSSKQGQDR